jgi:hypothetical protein
MGVEYLDDHRLRDADANAERNHDSSSNSNSPSAVALGNGHATVGNSNAAIGDTDSDSGLHAQRNPCANADRDAGSASPGAQSFDSDASSGRR